MDGAEPSVCVLAEFAAPSFCWLYPKAVSFFAGSGDHKRGTKPIQAQDPITKETEPPFPKGPCPAQPTDQDRNRFV